MFYKIVTFIIGIIIILGLITANIEEAYAVFTINARPYDGSFDIRFEKIGSLTKLDQEKEVTITINTDIATRYRVYQEISSPFVNSQGDTLPTQAFSVYSLRGSNSRGTLALDSEITVRPVRTLLYTSDAAGTNDSFIIVYRLNHSLVDISGVYRGRVSYLLEAVNSNEPPHAHTLNVELDIEMPSEIEVSTITGSRTVEIDSPESGLPAKVFISVQGQRQGQYKLTQMVEPLINREGEELREGIIFSVEAKEGGTAAQISPGPLKQGQSLLYTSDSLGSDDEIEITYGLEDGLIAGEYRGSVAYYVENPFSTSMRSGKIDTLPLEVNIEPVFELKVNPEAAGVIEFRNLKEGQIQEMSVIIEVESNLAKRYQVTQYISTLLTSKDGKAIPEGYFRFTTQEIDEKGKPATKGTLKYPTETEVSTDATVIFISNRKGEPDRFKVLYELTGPRDQFGGDYTTGIHYSLSQIDIE
ncbi:MAG: hypothetical protein JW869_04765 [Candidatus Omnitrophica bacterium]|nr:hypothetical protein [Candidatus Omnitrophota bacterium]